MEIQALVRRSILLGVGGIFLVAGLSKAADPAAFAQAISKYQILPWSACAILSLYLPYLELIAVGALAFSSHRKAALLLLFCMTAVFTTGLISAGFRGLPIDCGCFGSGIFNTGVSIAIVRNLMLLLGIFYVLKHDLPTGARSRNRKAKPAVSE